MLSRPGFELVANFLYNTEPLYAVLANSTTNPLDEDEAGLVGAEIDAMGGMRVPLVVDTAEFNPTTRNFDVSLSGSVASQITEVVNRIGLYRGGTGVIGDTTGDLIGVYSPQAAISLVTGATTSIVISGAHISS